MSAVSFADIAATAEELSLSIQPATVRKWVQRRKVRRYGRDTYDADDIAHELRRLARATPAATRLDAPDDSVSH